MTAFGASRYRAPHRRLRLFQVFSTAVFVGLLGSFWQIQVVDHERYREQARQNRIKTLPIAAARGNILDRHGRSIADSEIALTAMIDAANTSAANLERIASGLDLDVDRVWQTLQDASDYGRFEHIVLKEDLSQRDLAFLQARRHSFREVDLVEGMRRRYPDPQQVAVHATGYIGKASRQELAMREFLLLDFGSEIGKSGIERQYNRWLTGHGRQPAVPGRQRRAIHRDGGPGGFGSWQQPPPDHRSRPAGGFRARLGGAQGRGGRVGPPQWRDPGHGERAQLRPESIRGWIPGLRLARAEL